MRSWFPDRQIKRCPVCRHEKTCHPGKSSEFSWDVKRNRPASKCKLCAKAWQAEYRAKPEVREKILTYERTEDRKARKKQTRAQLGRVAEWRRRWRKTPYGAQVCHRAELRCMLRKATNPDRIALLQRRLAFCEKEIARIKQQREAERVSASDDMSLAEVSDELRLSEKRVRELIACGAIKSRKTDRRVWVTRGDLDDYRATLEKREKTA